MFMVCSVLDITPFKLLVASSNKDVAHVHPGELQNNGWSVPRIGNISAHIRQMCVRAHAIMQDDWNNTGIIARCKQRHCMYNMDLVSLPECPHLEELITHVNSGRKCMWKLWRAWPGAQEIGQRNEIINWMAASLMHQTKKTDFNSVLLDKLNTNILECKKLVGYVDDDDDSNVEDDDRCGPDDDGDEDEATVDDGDEDEATVVSETEAKGRREKQTKAQ